MKKLCTVNDVIRLAPKGPLFTLPDEWRRSLLALDCRKQDPRPAKYLRRGSQPATPPACRSPSRP